MGYREFIDSLGIVWKVWNTVPIAGAVLTSDMKNGWLTFESMTCCLRRLAPVPDEWDKLSTEQLERLCAEASDVQHRAHGTATANDSSEPNDDIRGEPVGNLNH